MKFNIILEGCDCVGKTSIFEEIMHRGLFGERMIGIQHTNKMPPESYEDGKKLNEELLSESNNFDGIVFDRHILSERIYGWIIRNYLNPVYPNYIDDLEKQLKSHNVLFLITAKLDTVKKRFDGQGIPFDKIPAILHGYIFHFERCFYPYKFIIDTTKISPYHALKQIEICLMTITDKGSNNLMKN